jgi:hypothetical protein
MRRWFYGLGLASLGLLVAMEARLFSGAREAEAAPAPKNAASKISKVTVYNNSALVTREVDVPDGDGLAELVVNPMPEHVIPSSLYCESGEGLRVLTTRYRTRQVLEDTSEERRKLEAEKEQLQVIAAKIQSDLDTLAKNMGMLVKLEGFTEKTALTSTEKGGLNGDTVITLAKWVMEQRGDKAKEFVALAEQKRQNDIKVNFCDRKMSELGRGGGREVRDAVLVVDREGGKGGKVRLNYLVSNVRWRPEYKLRAGKTTEDVKIECLANLVQQSGEDWNQVRLTLSTAQPLLNAAPPELAMLEPVLMDRRNPNFPGQDSQIAKNPGAGLPGGGPMPSMQVPPAMSRPAGGGIGGLAGGLGGGGLAPNAYGGAFAPPAPPMDLVAKSQELRRMADDKMTKGKGGEKKDVTKLLNEAAAQEQQVELMKTREEIAALALAFKEKKAQPAAATPTANEGPSVTYHLPNKLTVPSRNDEQIVEIAKLSLTPRYYYKAVPVLNRHVYRLADLVNKSNYVLLPGEATMYQGSDFVGRMALPLVAVGEEFTTGFGVDPQLQIQRQLVDKTRTTKGGNQVLTYDYRILVNSYKSEPVKLQVWDRLPKTEAESVGITLGKMSPELSKDALYLRECRPNNLLRWDLEVDPSRSGEKALAVTYEFSMELDRQMAISGFQSR